MKLRILLLMLLVFSINSFSQNIENVNIGVDGNVLSLGISSIHDNSTRIIEVTNISTKIKKIAYRKSVKNCSSNSKMVLVSGNYLITVTVINPDKNNYVEERRITII